MSLKIEAFDAECAFKKLNDEWKELQASSDRQVIFMTPEWQSNWWAAYHPGELWIIAVRDEDTGKLVGLAPWFIDHDHPKGRLVRSIGCVDVSYYLEPILRRGHEQEVLQALAQYAAENHDRFDRLDFCNIPTESPVLTLWQPILESAGFTVTIRQQEVCPVLNLPEDFEAYLRQLDKKQRHEVRRKMRRALGAENKTDWFYLDTQDQLQESMNRFLRLMRASHPEKAAFLDDPANLDFFRRVLPALAECGWLSVSMLQVDEVDAAAYLSFDYNNRIFLYNSGHDPEVHPELSPGWVLLAFVIWDAIDRRREAFDFLRGNEDYKYRLGGVDTPVMMLIAQ